MHILVVSQSWPHPGHDQLSVNQVTYALIRAFRQSAGCEVSFVCTYRPDRRPSETTAAHARTALAEIGVDVLATIELPEPPPVDRWKTLIGSRAEDFFPEVSHRERANDLVRAVRPDAVVVPWSERATQLFGEVDCLRVAYYGNPDPKNLRIASSPPIAQSRGLIRDWLATWRLANFERLHLQEMRRYDLFGDVAANDADYYRQHGIPGAFYTRMVYIDRAPADWLACRDKLELQTPRRIVASIGSQSATGNVLALHYLADHLLDRLNQRFGDDYEIVIAGGGRLPEDLSRKLNHSRIVNMGFVDDIDTLLLGAPVFLCLNNATAYKVNQSRYLHVWSLGGCIVAHRDASLSLPEMVHGSNALLGADPDEIVARISEALTDRDLRRRLGSHGRETFLADFNAEAVVADLLRRIRAKLDPHTVCTTDVPTPAARHTMSASQ